MVVTPSKRIRVLLIIAVVLIIGLIGYRLFGNKLFAKNQQANLQMVSPELSAQSDVDTDGDGLKDWQEALWGSDPKNSDTDNDGTADGEEVATGRDPIVPGPNDALSVTRPQTATSTASSTSFDSSDPYGAGDNSTDKLAREMFTQFMANGGSDNSSGMSSDTQQQIVNQSVSDIQTPSITPSYSLTDLHLANSDSKSALQTYADSLAKVSKKTLQSYASADPNTAAFTDLIEAFNEEAKALIAIPAPGTIATLHLNLVNNYDEMYQGFKLLNTYSATDPVKALFAIQAIQSFQANQAQVYAQLASYFEKNDILFDKNGPGFSLINATSS
jgi:hypothetical protein